MMEAEFKRLVMRSPFDVRVEKPRREGESTLLYPFDPRVAWVAACYHRTSSHILEICSSNADSLWSRSSTICFPPLRRKIPRSKVRFSVEVGAASDFEASPFNCVGSSNAIVEAFTSHAIAADLDAESPDIVFVARRAGTPRCVARSLE